MRQSVLRSFLTENVCPRLPNWRISKKMLWRNDDSPVASLIVFDDSLVSMRWSHVWAVAFPLYLSVEAIPLNISTDLTSVSSNLDPIRASEIASELVQAIADQAEPFWIKFSSLEGLTANLSDLYADDSGIPPAEQFGYLEHETLAGAQILLNRPMQARPHLEYLIANGAQETVALYKQAVPRWRRLLHDVKHNVRGAEAQLRANIDVNRRQFLNA